MVNARAKIAGLALLVVAGVNTPKAKPDIVDIWTQPESGNVVQGQSSYFDVMAVSQVPIINTDYDLNAAGIEQITPENSGVGDFWEDAEMGLEILAFPGGNLLGVENRNVGHNGPGALSRHYFTVPQDAIPGTVVTPYFSGYVEFEDVNRNTYHVNDGVTIIGQGSSIIRERKNGDLNCDGSVNFGDINSFVYALTDPDAFQGCKMNGDMNGDGSVNFKDINPFVARLANPE